MMPGCAALLCRPKFIILFKHCLYTSNFDGMDCKRFFKKCLNWAWPQTPDPSTQETEQVNLYEFEANLVYGKFQASQEYIMKSFFKLTHTHHLHANSHPLNISVNSEIVLDFSKRKSSQTPGLPGASSHQLFSHCRKL